MFLNRRIRFQPTVFAAACFVFCAAHATIAAETSFTIKRDVIHRIDPHVFGQFMERPSWGEVGIEGGLIPGTRKVQPAVMKMLDELGVERENIYFDDFGI